MNTDAKLELMLDILRSAPMPESPTIEDQRRGFDSLAAKFPVHPDVTVEHVDAGGVPAELVTAVGADPERTMLYLHGGAFVIGSARVYREQAARLSKAIDGRVLVIDYRRAPEHPFPAALDDSVAACRWLVAQGVQPESLVVAGDSAGANLALAVMLVLREAGEVLPAAAVCLSPWVDLLCEGESMVTNANPRHLAQKPSLLTDTGYYLNGADPRNPLASPIHADLSELPPMLIQVGSAETLVDDATHLAERAREVGVDVTLEVWEGMIHEWHLLASLLPEDDPLQEAADAVEHIGRFVRRHTARPKPAVVAG